MYNFTKAFKLLILMCFSISIFSKASMANFLNFSRETITLQEQSSIRIALERFKVDCQFDLTDYVIDMDRRVAKKDSYEIRVTFFNKADLENHRDSIYEVKMQLEPKGILLIRGALNKARVIKKEKEVNNIRLTLQEFSAIRFAYQKFTSIYKGELTRYSVSLTRNKFKTGEVNVLFHDADTKQIVLGNVGAVLAYGVSISLLTDRLKINSAGFVK